MDSAAKKQKFVLVILTLVVVAAATVGMSFFRKTKIQSHSLAESGESCAVYHSGKNSPFEKATCLLESGKNLSPGESIEGFERSYALFPKTCGEKTKTSCVTGGRLVGTAPLYSSCTQLCVNPVNHEPTEAGRSIAYYLISTGTKEQCENSRVVSVCDSKSGNFAPEPPQEKIFNSCTVLVAEEAEILRWSDPKTWGGKLPQAGANIVVPENKIILLDQNPPELSSLQIHGILTFDNQDLILKVGAIVLKGTLQIGSPSAPYSHSAVIKLLPTQANDSPTFMRGLFLQGGKLDLHGLPLKNADQVRKPAEFAWGLPQFENISLEK